MQVANIWVYQGHFKVPNSHLILRVFNFPMVKKSRNQNFMSKNPCEIYTHEIKYHGKKFESQKNLINMINNDMYSLCIDINNKLFPGKLHFASCQVWSIKVICKDFTWKYRAENLTTHPHLNYCLRANPLEYLSCSRQNCHYLVPCNSHSQVSCTVPTLTHSSRWSRFRCKQWQEFQGQPVWEGISDT